MINIVRMNPSHGASLTKAINSVIAERQYLLSVKPKSVLIIDDFIQKHFEHNTMLVGLNEDRVVAWFDILRKAESSQSHVGVLAIGVVKAYRGFGLGEQLMQLGLQDAQKRGLRRIELETFSTNHRALALYHRFGFEREGEKQSAWQDQGRLQHITLMAKHLLG